ncbi:uncharacterized protein AB675_9357 [Cyphellophora attinorum]|uniref:Beta-galactosidase n=1 Tax=Cyphellophora attinorum TaxID=1664694 RepID=A0A0N0NNR8_9EURO|nr:uncharacterized protein AB675_9357 [Phialophora attinorum]KPI41699.1 hypothetical protein AB675_9357 [Phialophora attinorum]
MPHLRQTKNSYQMIVNGKPFMMLAGELHNSSLSSAAYMSTVWPTMKHMNINTLLGSVTWEMIEPVEGQFDFSELDKVILGAREHGLHLVLLWFGSFKNALSTYAPAWVKRDVNRFPRVHVLDDDRKLKTIELVSPFNSRAWEADARAFGTLMKHLKQFDGEHSTVLMVQVENETGLLGDSRDRSRAADVAFNAPVPSDLLAHLKSQERLHPMFEKRWPRFQATKAENTSWEAVFGKGVAAEEMFMADAFARYVGHVAAAGRKAYNIPMYANVWLNFDDPSVLDLEGIPLGEGTPTVAGGGAKAGVYPSGGPVPHALDIWNYHAVDDTKLNFIAPDLYLHDYDWVCKQYTYRNNPLFIPEQKADAFGVRRTWLAYGTYGCMGCSPFGIDTVELDPTELAFWRRSNGLLHCMRREILTVQADRPEDMFGFFFDELKDGKPPGQWRKTFGDMEVIVDRSFVFGRPGPGYGIVIHQGEGKFLLIGSGFQTTFRSTKPESTFTGILSSEEKMVDEDGKLTTLRTMNGDETRSGAFFMMPTEEPDYGGFPIRVTIPARTYIAEVTAYSLEENAEHY